MRAMTFFLFLVLAAVILGIIGWVVKGLLYLFAIGVVVFVLSVFVFGVRLGRRRTRVPR